MIKNIEDIFIIYINMLFKNKSQMIILDVLFKYIIQTYSCLFYYLKPLIQNLL